MEFLNKPTILFVDHDPMVEQTVKAIGTLYDDQRRKLIDEFDVQFQCIPIESDIYESILESYKDKLPALVLIDLFYMDNRRTTNAFNLSLIKLKELHDRLWGIPLGVFTKETLEIEERISIECNDIRLSSMGFTILRG